MGSRKIGQGNPYCGVVITDDFSLRTSVCGPSPALRAIGRARPNAGTGRVRLLGARRPVLPP